MSDNRGREATRPREIGAPGWKDVLKRVRREMKHDNLTIVAAGVAFYAFLALFPALAAVVSIYGLVADPHEAQRQLMELSRILPSGVQDITGDQLQRLASSPQSAMSWGLVLGLLLTLWSANKGMSGLVQALNIVYDEEERRGFFKLNAMTLMLTLGAVVSVVVAIALVAIAPAVLGMVGLSGVARVAISILRWPLLAALVLFGLAVVYRFGPSRERAKWRWVSPGALVATVGWLIVSIGFSLYVANFDNYNETYGALGAVAILLMWFFLSAYVILVGAELNAEAEHQTRQDSTTGPPEAMGERGAYDADTLGESPAK